MSRSYGLVWIEMPVRQNTQKRVDQFQPALWNIDNKREFFFFFCFKRAIVIVEMVELDYSIPSFFIGR